MEVSRLTRWSAIAAVVAGVLLSAAEIVLTFFASGSPTAMTTADRLSSLLFFTGAVALLLGTPSFYLYHAKQAGTLGLVAFVVSLIGAALMVSSDWNELFVVPFFAAQGVTEAPPLTVAGFIMNFAFYMLGWLLLAIAAFRARVFPRMVAIALVAGLLLAATGLPAAFLLAYLVFGWMGVIVLRGQSQAALKPNTVSASTATPTENAA